MSSAPVIVGDTEVLAVTAEPAANFRKDAAVPRWFEGVADADASAAEDPLLSIKPPRHEL